jgi:DNA-binding XRE family transcriptional regulator
MSSSFYIFLGNATKVISFIFCKNLAMSNIFGKERAKHRLLNTIDRQLADKIKWYRRNNNMTQEELSEKLGRHLTYVAGVEGYKTGISLPVIYKLCKIFSIKPKDLFDF